MITIDIYYSEYNRNFEKIIDAINERRSNTPLELNLSMVQTDNIHKPMERIIKTLTQNSCPDNLTILLKNCAITNSEIYCLPKHLVAVNAPRKD